LINHPDYNVYLTSVENDVLKVAMQNPENVKLAIG